MNNKQWIIWGSHSIVAKDSNLLEPVIVQVVFNVLKDCGTFKTSASTHKEMQCHIPDDTVSSLIQ